MKVVTDGKNKFGDTRKRKAYDTYKCAQCGLTGKSYHLGTITIAEKDISKVYKCKGLKKLVV